MVNGLGVEAIFGAGAALFGGITRVVYVKADRAEKEAQKANTSISYLNKSVDETKSMVRDIHKHMLKENK